MNEQQIWVLIGLVVVTIIVATPLLYRGAKVRTKLVEIDTTKERLRVESIPVYHLRQFRKLKNDVIGYVTLCRKEYKAYFRGSYALFLTSLGLDANEVLSSKEKLLYKVTLETALGAIFQEMTSDAICNNHFPLRKADSDGNYIESEQEFEERFYLTYTLPLTVTILGLTTDFIDNSWESKIVSRADFKAIYINSEEAHEHIFKKFSSLIVRSRKHRNHIFEQIMRHDGSELQTLFDEWEIIYG